ncbi:hypothetical protein GGTG_08326 [Gaeumannomyces tritici R3-111a-1]|uniref:DUF7707 domain-containing protein n=1 Tax=Gaeumannomyces tritici (strain R3-111a-1) TaxID=644352 RepID=J3P490_GAET3|nr:hypothetical protein GGTG_08326 [Gaeumannomyces tritici R3-111a-1]EJT74486.1 hypothetical protein GGTG_08326 [Gaeumannomyces tritici R3-111a-1]
MVSLRSTLMAAAAIVAGVQADYFIQPSSVPLGTRNAWCTSQKTQCPPICLDMDPASGRPIKNTCDAATLNYECLCGNNVAPNLTEYSLTMPYHKCVQFQENCVGNCGLANNACADSCRKDIKCGAASPKGATNITASSTAGGSAAATSTTSGPTLQTGFGNAGGGGGSSSSNSLQASLSLALAITGVLVAPLML